MLHRWFQTMSATLALLLLGGGCLPSPPNTASDAPVASLALTRAAAPGVYGKIPLSFVTNQGQWDPRVAFRTQQSQADTWFTSGGIRTAMVGQTGEDVVDSERHGRHGRRQA